MNLWRKLRKQLTWMEIKCIQDNYPFHERREAWANARKDLDAEACLRVRPADSFLLTPEEQQARKHLLYRRHAPQTPLEIRCYSALRHVRSLSRHYGNESVRTETCYREAEERVAAGMALRR